MIEAKQSYHPQIVRAIIAMAMFEARKEIKRNIQREGRIHSEHLHKPGSAEPQALLLCETHDRNGSTR
jgi:hypothetical protein